MAREAVSEVDRLRAKTVRGRDEHRTALYLRGVARILRTQLPDGYFHLTALSVQEAPLFRDDEDRLAFIALFKRALRRWTLGFHVYCLMTNHYHAVVDGPVERLSPAVQWFQSHYAREHNHRFGRKGALFASRFSSWVIHDEDHYDATIAYVLDNPVRAGLVERAEDWPWSAVRRPSEHTFPNARTDKLVGYG